MVFYYYFCDASRYLVCVIHSIPFHNDVAMVKFGTRERIPHRTYDPTVAPCRVPIGWARNLNDLSVGRIHV